MEKVSHIADKLRQEILEGEYGQQGILPSRLQLAEHFQVTTGVINNALSQLLAEGLLITQGRSRLVVNRTKAK